MEDGRKITTRTDEYSVKLSFLREKSFILREKKNIFHGEIRYMSYRKITKNYVKFFLLLFEYSL